MADKMQEEFEKTTQMFKAQNMPKRLVNDGVFVTEFEANGKKYKVMKPNEVFNISRATAYTNIKIAFDLCQTPTQIKLLFLEMKGYFIQMFNADSATEKARLLDLLLRCVWGAEDSFKGEFTKMYPPGLYICTLFVVAENEDLAEDCTWESANEKIKDWHKENLNAYDFFLLALSSSTESQEIMKQNY